MTIDYSDWKVVNGTWYHPSTPDNLISVLEQFRHNFLSTGTQSTPRLTFVYGNSQTGETKGHTVSGWITRSMGPVRVALIKEKPGDVGCDCLYTEKIVRVQDERWRTIYYCHPDYKLVK